jgi:DNA topoisomerase VI subunit B
MEGIMAKTKKSGSQVIQGGINIKGNVTINRSKVAGGNMVEKNVTNLNVSFAPVYHALKENATIPPKAKKAVEQSVRQIEMEVKKGEAAQVSFIQQRLENIEKMAPDIADVVIATLQNPVAGISTAVKKVLDKMQAARAK